MSEPLLHVLVPSYGPSPYLAEALTSLVAAADERTIVTVVDDGSPGAEVQQAAATQPTVEYLRLDANHGVAGAFQRCLELSRGDYTVLMGSDDLVEPSYVAEVRALLRRFGRPAMVLPGVTVIDGQGHVARPHADRVKGVLSPRGHEPRLLGGDRLAASLLMGNWLYFPAMAWRTDVARQLGFRQDLSTVLDLHLELRLLFDGEQLAWSPRPAFRYRRHAQSESSRTAGSGARFAEEQQVFRWAAREAAALGWRRAAAAARLHPTARLHAGLVRASRLRQRRRQLGSATGSAPPGGAGSTGPE